MTIDEAREHIGSWVMYEPWPGAPRKRQEIGIVKSVNDAVAFVRYMEYDTPGQSAKATKPGDLRLI